MCKKIWEGKARWAEITFFPSATSCLSWRWHTHYHSADKKKLLLSFKIFNVSKDPDLDLDVELSASLAPSIIQVYSYCAFISKFFGFQTKVKNLITRRQCYTFSRLIPVMLQLYDEMKAIENDSQYFEIWYGIHSFNLASNHISWAELGLVSQT